MDDSLISSDEESQIFFSVRDLLDKAETVQSGCVQDEGDDDEDEDPDTSLEGFIVEDDEDLVLIATDDEESDFSSNSYHFLLHQIHALDARLTKLEGGGKKRVYPPSVIKPE